MIKHYIKVVGAGIVIASIVTGLNILIGLLFKWVIGHPVVYQYSIKHVIVFGIILLLSASYLSIRQPDRD